MVDADGGCWWKMLVEDAGGGRMLVAHAGGACWWRMLRMLVVHAGGACCWRMLVHKPMAQASGTSQWCMPVAHASGGCQWRILMTLAEMPEEMLAEMPVEKKGTVERRWREGGGAVERTARSQQLQNCPNTVLLSVPAARPPSGNTTRACT